MTELGEHYKATRERITELVRSRSDDELARTVPACPEWSVQDTVAHVAGVASDIVTGNIEGAATDPWTAAQVAARKGWTIDKILDEWAETGQQVDPIVPFFPGRVGPQLVLDVTTHEHDIRHALGEPGPKDPEAVDIAAKMIVEVGLTSGMNARGLPPIEVIAGDQRWVLGTGEPAVAADEEAVADAIMTEGWRVLYGGDPVWRDGVTPIGSLKIEPFELVRAMTGRRSAAQIRAYDWTVDPEPYLVLFGFGIFTTPQEDMVE